MQLPPYELTLNISFLDKNEKKKLLKSVSVQEPGYTKRPLGHKS